MDKDDVIKFIDGKVYYYSDYINFLYEQLQLRDEIIKEIREVIRMYELQSKTGKNNDLDDYVFIQRLKSALEKENK